MFTFSGLNIHFKLFQYCGLNSGSKPPSSRTGLIIRVIRSWPAFLGLTLSMIELYLLYTYREISFHKGTMIGFLTGVLEVIAPIFTVIIMILENLFTHHLDAAIWKTIERIEGRAPRKAIPMNAGGNWLTFQQYFQLKFVIVLGIGIAMDIYVGISAIEFDAGWARTIMYSLRSVTTARIGILQVVLYVEWAVHRCGLIQRCILAAMKSNRVQQQIDIKEMGIIYSELWLFGRCLNRRFGAGLLAAIINCFLCITISLYWIITRIKFNKFMTRKFCWFFFLYRCVDHHLCSSFHATFLQLLLSCCYPTFLHLER